MIEQRMIKMGNFKYKSVRIKNPRLSEFQFQQIDIKSDQWWNKQRELCWERVWHHPFPFRQPFSLEAISSTSRCRRLWITWESNLHVMSRLNSSVSSLEVNYRSIIGPVQYIIEIRMYVSEIIRPNQLQIAIKHPVKQHI